MVCAAIGDCHHFVDASRTGTKADKVAEMKVKRPLAESMREDSLMMYVVVMDVFVSFESHRHLCSYNYVEIDATDPQHVKKLLDLALAYLTL